MSVAVREIRGTCGIRPVSVAEYASAELSQNCGCAVLVTSDGSFGRPRGEVISEEEAAEFSDRLALRMMNDAR